MTQSQSKGGFAKIVVVAVVAGGIGLALWQWLGTSRTTVAGDGGPGEIVEPVAPSTLAQTGRVAFEANCAACHGERGGGTDSGPPFVNDIYNPGHHPDEAFMVAPRLGVRAHHWPFGNMPPVEGVTDDELRAIVQYVRELQEANGIFYKPHVM